jgi:aryl-alcohol dehydrogenase-like predicted oxidoreductase
MKPDFQPGRIAFGLGLIGIGRLWGHVPGEIPSEPEAREFLDYAFEAGVRYFDTAPSYGYSEQRVGAFLRTLAPAERAALTVATKFGEHWDFDRWEPFTDHSYAALARSLERSLEILGPIDVLQLHKTTPKALRSDEVEQAWDLARSLGITELGPSASDLESARIACAAGQFQMMQLPLNFSNERFIPVLDEVRQAGMWLAVNRPFGMGVLAAERVRAFEYVIARIPRGVILSGTKSKTHLKENLGAFHACT